MSGLSARLLLWSSFCVCPFAQAQDRMPPLAAEDLTEAQAASVAELERVRGYGPRGPWIPLLRSPELMIRARAMGDYLRFNSSLPPRLSEFVILMAAREWTQEYEWHAHRDIAIDAGLRPEIVQAIAEGRYPDGMAEDEAVLYEFCRELNGNKFVSDEIYAGMIAQFGERGLIDAVGIMGYYTLLAMVMNTARTPLPDGAEPELSSIP
jgi:4-carboxymuconolactone decarboxylase